MVRNILLILAIGGFIFLSLAVVSAVEIDQCQSLETQNTEYFLNKSVTSSDTCFTLAANNITLDCRGYEINYSNTSAEGYGIYSSGFDNSVLKNCIIRQANSTSSSKHGIYMINNQNWTLFNNTVITNSSASNGLYLNLCQNFNVSENTITTSFTSASPMYITFGNNLTLRNNILSSYSVLGHGIYLSGAQNSTLSNNTITISATATNGMYALANAFNNVLSNNTIVMLGTTGRGIYIAGGNYTSILNNNCTSYWNSMGIYLTYSSYTKTESNKIKTTNNSGLDLNGGSGGVLRFNDIAVYGVATSSGLSITGNNITASDNNITTFDKTLMGALSLGSGSGINLSNFNITTYGAVSPGIYFSETNDDISINNFAVTTFSNNSEGIAFYYYGARSHKATILDSSINTLNSVGINVTREEIPGGWFNLTNVTLSNRDIIVSGNFSVFTNWYLDVNVSNTTSQVDTANVSLYDKNNNLLSSEATDNNGRIARKTLLEYVKNGSTSIFYTNFNMTILKEGFNLSYTSINLTSNQFRKIVLYQPNEIVIPTLTILSPVNTTYYSNQSIAVEFSADPSYQSRWYSQDMGATNTSYTSLGYINFTSNGNKSVRFYANNTLNNISSSEVFISIIDLPANTSIAVAQLNLEINNTMEMVVVVHRSALKTLEVPRALENKSVAVNLKQVTQNNVATLRDVAFNLSRFSITNNSVEFQANTTITANTGWDGLLNVPIVNSSGFSVSSGNLNTAITISSNSPLNLSNPAKIILGGMYGKSAAWSEDSLDLAKILTYCNSLTNPTNINNATTRECYTNSDNNQDLIIWSYHLSNFAAYTPIASSSNPSSSGGGGAYIPADYKVTEKQIKKGYYQILGEEELIEFQIGDKTHYIQVKKIDNFQARVTITGAVETVLENKQERFIDVILEGKVYTLYLKVEFINSADKIGLTIKKIAEKTIQDTARISGRVVSEKTEEYENRAMIIGAVIAIIVVALIITLVKRKKLVFK